MDFDKTHLNILSIIKTFCSSLPDQLSRLCPPHFYLPILTFLDYIYIVWTFYSYGHFTLWTFSDSSNLYGHFITMDNFPYGFFTHRSNNDRMNFRLSPDLRIRSHDTLGFISILNFFTFDTILHLS